MLLDFDILKELGTTDDRLKEICTATEGADAEVRKDWERSIQSKIEDGARSNLNNYHFYAAADMAWDSNLISKELIPLQMYAQGKIEVKALLPVLKDMSEEARKQFVKTNEKGEITSVSIPEFHKVVISFVRSIVKRRKAALSVKYTDLFPLYKYEAFGTSWVDKLRADVLSQRVEQVARAYNYRHDVDQAILEMLLYSHTAEFVGCAWETEYQLRRKKDSKEIESYISREGIPQVRPHPSRVYFDTRYPLSSINSDTGCEYLGYWTPVRYKEVGSNTAYWNRKAIVGSSSLNNLLAQHSGYFGLYFSNSPINFPNFANQTGTVDVAAQNDRLRQTGLYTSAHDEQSLLLTEHFEKIIPIKKTLGKYPHPVWVRLVVAGGTTIVYGEILPSTPAIYYGTNCHDGKLLNNSLAHDAIPFQDQLSNMLTNLLHAQKAALIKIIALDVDQIRDGKMLDTIRSIVTGDSIYSKPMLLEYSGSVIADTGQDPRKVVTVSETSAMQNVTAYFDSILRLFSIAERTLGVSANESAQSEPREISATESANINSTVNMTLASMAMGIDEAFDARKRQLYEAFLAKGNAKIYTPVIGRYTPEVVKAAGFEAVSDELGASDAPQQLTITGEKQSLGYDFVFTSRDGSERAVSTQSAEVLVRLLQTFAQLQVLPALGKKRLFALCNEIARLTGASSDLKFDMEQGEPDEVGVDVAAQHKDEITQIVQQLLAAVEKDRADIAQIQQILARFMGQPQQVPTQ